MDVRDELLDLEGRFWEAAGDAGFYQDHFADDGVMAFHVGIMGKAEVLGAMSGAGEWESYTIDDVRYVRIADDVASLTYTTEAFAPGSDEPYEAAITSLYVRRDDRWFLILHQQSPLE